MDGEGVPFGVIEPKSGVGRLLRIEERPSSSTKQSKRCIIS